MSQPAAELPRVESPDLHATFAALSPSTPLPWDTVPAMPSRIFDANGSEVCKITTGSDGPWSDAAAMIVVAVNTCGGFKAELPEGPPAAELRILSPQEVDPVGSFIAECLEPGAEHSIPAGEAYAAFTSWCRRQALQPWQATRFARAMAMRGVVATRAQTRLYAGFRLKPDLAVEADDGWRWWASDDEESYSVGPCDSREAVIAKATAEGLGQWLGGLGAPQSFHIIEARQDPIDLAIHFDPDSAIERLMENIDENHGNPDTGSLSEGAWTDAEAADLGDMLAATVRAWQAKHGFTLRPWLFSASRNGETVSIEREPGAPVDLSTVEVWLKPAARDALDRSHGFPSHPAIDALSANALAVLASGLRNAPAEDRRRCIAALHVLITRDLSEVSAEGAAFVDSLTTQPAEA